MIVFTKRISAVGKETVTLSQEKKKEDSNHANLCLSKMKSPTAYDLGHMAGCEIKDQHCKLK